MPQNEEILQILANQNITYYTCKKIVEILKETEKDTKNIFGYYSSERMKEWQEILNMYETNGIYLVESAQNLVRNVTYEVPSLKKNINRLQQLHDEYTKKHHEYIKQSKHFKKEYFADSQRLGLKGEDIVQEINAILVEFPIFLSTRITNRLEQLKTCRDRYVTFLRFINNSDSTNDSLVLPLLVYLLNKGNTTYYEYETGEVPQVIQLNFELNNQIGTSKSNEEDQIDFGDEIDFGDQIDFCDKVDFGDQIDFGDNQAADCANFENSNETKLTDSSGKNEEKKATGLYALTLLEHPITRTNFINELSEVIITL